jgi:MoxR-like ATPase
MAAEELAAVEKLQQSYHQMRAELGKVIVGQDAVIEELLIALFCKGHALLVGVPGLAKTLLISTLARTLGLTFSRIQFTPDLMPSDITGTEVIEEDKTTGGRTLRFVRGPVFANVILADEINRTPPKTQAALLEAMQEHQVTAGGLQHRLPQPFFVLATQNPIEQEGTYPLPEAQLDRFMFNINVGYPSEEEEFQIVRMTTQGREVELKQVLSGEEVISLQSIVRKVPVADHVIRYALKFSRLTRRTEGGCPDFVNDYVGWGAGPRASQYLILAG